jgi:hypothetical protein
MCSVQDVIASKWLAAHLIIPISINYYTAVTASHYFAAVRLVGFSSVSRGPTFIISNGHCQGATWEAGKAAKEKEGACR